ncbi:MAG: hypothetical protein RLZZ342_201 [Candidatus Parcubacteria bacterium]|jgi:methionyl aminopeptidase
MIAKTPEEIAIIRESGRRLGHHLARLSELVVVGATPRDIENAAKQMIEDDGDVAPFHHYPSGRKGEKFPGVICVSVNDTIVHAPGTWNDTPFEEGDMVTIDFGVQHQGLITDSARTIIVGKPRSPEEAKMLSAAYEALQLGIDQARVGNTTGHIGNAIQRVAEAHGYGYPLNLAGHGVGTEVHEEPHVPNYGVPGEGEKLVEGLVIAIEPMFTMGKGDVYVDKDSFTYKTKDGSRSCHVEHTVLITKDGPEILTRDN